MDDATISAVVSEIAPLLLARAPGKIFQLGHQSLAIDFGLRQQGYLYFNAEPAAPRLHLLKRRLRDLEKQSIPLTPFGQILRKELSQTKLAAVEKMPDDRVVLLTFDGLDDLGKRSCRYLVAQLTGRSANLFLLNDDRFITACARETKGSGQSPGEKYQPPQSAAGQDSRQAPLTATKVSTDTSISEVLDQHYASREAKKAADARLAAARTQISREIARSKKLLKQLERDLTEHSEAEQHKRIGELLLANVGTATRQGGRLKIIDYFAEGAPEIEVEIDDKLTIPEEASRRFEMYARSKRARVQIAGRIKLVKTELAAAEQKREQIELNQTAPYTVEQPAAGTATKSKTVKARVPGARRYMSSDGYEILVGRAARDNDNLTFKVAKPNDLWLHAADYPGSHVIVRNPARKEIPQRTLIEAAQLTAYFSQASKDPKVDVHYTERKFLSKPRGGAPGLVRMSRFKNITVAPAEVVPRVT